MSAKCQKQRRSKDQVIGSLGQRSRGTRLKNSRCFNCRVSNQRWQNYCKVSHVFIFHRFAGEWVGESIKILRFDVGMKSDMRISTCVGPILRTPCAQKLTRLFVDSLSTTNRKSLIGPDQLASVVRMYSRMCRSHIKFGVLSIAFKTAELMQKRSVDGPIPNFRAS